MNKSMKNLTKGARIFKIAIGIIIVASLYLQESARMWLLWALVVILVITASVKYCPFCNVFDKTKKKLNLTKGEVLLRSLIGIYIVLVLYAIHTTKIWLLGILAVILIITGSIGYCPFCHTFKNM